MIRPHRPLTSLRRVLAVAAVVLASGPTLSEARDAAGDPPQQATAAAPKESAESLEMHGAELMHQKHYEEAIELLARAYQLDPSAETLLQLGLSELFADHPVEAAEHLRKYVSRKDAPSDKLRVVERKWLPQAEQKTARLEIYVPAGAEIVVDGTPQDRPAAATSSGMPPGQAQLTIVIRAGEHDVAEHYGTAEEVKHVVATGGERVEIHFQPLPEAPDAAPQPSKLSPWEEVPTPNETRMARKDSRASSTAKWVTVIGLGSAAVLSAGVAVAFTVAFNDASGDAGQLMQALGPSGCAQTTSPSCVRLRQDHDAEHTDADLATGFYVGATVAALGAAASWALWPSPSHSSSQGALHVTPTVDARQLGLAMSGAW